MTHKENVPKWVRQRFAATIQYMNEKGIGEDEVMNTFSEYHVLDYRHYT